MELYRVHDSIRDILSKVDDDGEVPADLSFQLDAVVSMTAAEMEDLVAALKNAKAESAIFRAESQRLASQARLIDEKAEAIEVSIRGLLAGDTMWSGGVHAIRLQRNSVPTIRVREGDEIPAGFERVKVELDGKAAQKAWSEGRLPESLIAVVGDHLRVS